LVAGFGPVLKASLVLTVGLIANRPTKSTWCAAMAHPRMSLLHQWLPKKQNETHTYTQIQKKDRKRNEKKKKKRKAKKKKNKG
jgi:hypothetical protein